MSQFPHQSNQSITPCYGRCNVTGLDIDEWLKDESEQFADIERYDAALKNAQPVSAPENFLAPHGNALEGFLAPQGNVLQGVLAPQGNVLEGFLAPQVTVPQHVLDQVPVKYGPIAMPCYPKLNNIALSNNSCESSNLTVPQERVHWVREEQMLFGNWEEVSNFVGSETSPQVASHADNHMKVSGKERKRKSIHDTTLQDNVFEGFLAPQVTVPQHVLDHVPAKYGPTAMPCYPKFNNIALSNNFCESSNLTVPHKRVHWAREEQSLLGNWKEVSNFVGSETLSQVASHADNHMKVSGKKRKRKSIHDTTLQNTDINMILLPHIDQQNWVPILNFAMQQPYDLDLAMQQFYKRQ